MNSKTYAFIFIAVLLTFTFAIIKGTFDKFKKINPTEIKQIRYHHPEIKSATEIYQIQMSESVSDVCFDGRFKKIVVIEGSMILQQCELDSNRWHFNIKTK